MRRHERRTDSQRQTSLRRKRTRHELRKKRKQKDQNPLSIQGEGLSRRGTWAPNLLAMFKRPGKEK